MKTYEVVNPSDKVFIEAESDAVADFCTIFASGGSYGANEVDGPHKTPFFMLGGDVDEYYRDQHGVEDLVRWMNENKAAIEACCESAVVAGQQTSMTDVVGMFRELPSRVKWEDEGNE